MAEELHFVRAPVGRLPLDIVYWSNAQISIILKNPNIQLYDFSAGTDNVAAFWEDEFIVGDHSNYDVETYSYNSLIDYKQQPKLLKWLQAQNLPNPLEKND